MSEFGTPETPSYMGMAERLRRMQNKTPDRFRREPGPKPEPWVGRKRATQVKFSNFFFRFFSTFTTFQKFEKKFHQFFHSGTDTKIRSKHQGIKTSRSEGAKSQ